jgi:cytosine/adenosine deaminase-related metal-dependent hydrolase
VLPIVSGTIEDGAVAIAGRRIVGIGKSRAVSREFSGRVFDLGDAVLLPGLINVHCHLDYTSMAGHLPPMRLFTDWLKLITEMKSGWDREDYRQSWLKGAAMLLSSGTTMVGDIEAVPELLPELWRKTPLRIFSFLEMIGITGKRSPDEILAGASQKISTLGKSRKHQAGLSPHAPYSTLPELLCKSAQKAQKRNWRICMHVGESELEYRMFSQARGAMHDWMKRSGRSMLDCGKGSPLEHAACCGLLSPRFIAVHLNYLGRNDIHLLSRSGAHVVHCPRSHEYFAHRKFPLKRLQAAGVNVCLGSDSLASVLKRRSESVHLDMFEEMRSLCRAQPSVSPAAALRMATQFGAKALGMASQIGELRPGALADLIAVPLNGARKATEAVLAHRGPVLASMIDGRWAVRPKV